MNRHLQKILRLVRRPRNRRRRLQPIRWLAFQIASFNQPKIYTAEIR